MKPALTVAAARAAALNGEFKPSLNNPNCVFLIKETVTYYFYRNANKLVALVSGPNNSAFEYKANGAEWFYVGSAN